MPEDDTKSSIYAGGLPYELTEGDIICVFSQYGEIFEISLSRDKETGKSRGFCFIKYEDPRSSELAVDNLNGTTIVGRKIKVSYANNTGAIKATRPTIVAPQTHNTASGHSCKETDEEGRHHSKRKHDTPSPYSRSRRYSPRDRDESVSPRTKGRHHSPRDRVESVSPRTKRRHHSSRDKDGSISPRHSKYHTSRNKDESLLPRRRKDRPSSRHRRDYSRSPSRSHHKSSRHRKEKSPPPYERYPRESKKKDDHSPSIRREHRRYSRDESNPHSSRSSRSETNKRRY